MKKWLLLFSTAISLFANNGRLVGNQAPDFKAKVAINNSIEEIALSDFRGKYVVLFFYPLDFTFVCPTELHAFQEKIEAFTKRNAQLIGCSVDSAFTHLAWLDTPRTRGGIAGVTYPLIADLDKSIASQYEVLDEKEGIAYRGLFLIDREGVIRHQVVNDFPLGRNVDEAIRMLDALISFEKEGEVCPANWRPGDKTLKPTTEGLIEFFSESE